jgi:hypothetical protein
MKKLAIIIGLAVILAAAIALWAQQDPDMPTPMSKFYGHIYYSGGSCGCRSDDFVFIERLPDHSRWEIQVQSCGTNGAEWSTEPIFPSAQYYIWGVFSGYSGCDSTKNLLINHNGSYDQEVDLYAQ